MAEALPPPTAPDYAARRKELYDTLVKNGVDLPADPAVFERDLTSDPSLQDEMYDVLRDIYGEQKQALAPADQYWAEYGVEKKSPNETGGNASATGAPASGLVDVAPGVAIPADVAAAQYEQQVAHGLPVMPEITLDPVAVRPTPEQLAAAALTAQQSTSSLADATKGVANALTGGTAIAVGGTAEFLGNAGKMYMDAWDGILNNSAGQSAAGQSIADAGKAVNHEAQFIGAGLREPLSAAGQQDIFEHPNANNIAAAAGGALGSLLPVLATGGYAAVPMAVGQSMDAAKQAGVSDEEAVALTAATAPLVALLDKAGASSVGGAAGKAWLMQTVTGLLRRSGQEVTEASATQATALLLREAVKQTGKAALTEGATEAGQSIVSEEGKALADLLRGGEEKYGVTQWGVAKQAALEGTIGGWVGGGLKAAGLAMDAGVGADARPAGMLPGVLPTLRGRLAQVDAAQELPPAVVEEVAAAQEPAFVPTDAPLLPAAVEAAAPAAPVLMRGDRVVYAEGVGEVRGARDPQRGTVPPPGEGSAAIGRLFDDRQQQTTRAGDTVIIGPPAAAVRAFWEEQAGAALDENTVHIVDKSALNHIIGRHGTPDEVLQGQRPVTKEDVMRIPEILAAPDAMEVVTGDDGAPAVQYTKRFNGTTYYVEAARNKRGFLAAKTLYVRKTKTGGHPGGAIPAEASRTPTSETDRAAASTPIDASATETVAAALVRVRTSGVDYVVTLGESGKTEVVGKSGKPLRETHPHYKLAVKKAAEMRIQQQAAAAERDADRQQQVAAGLRNADGSVRVAPEKAEADLAAFSEYVPQEQSEIAALDGPDATPDQRADADYRRTRLQQQQVEFEGAVDKAYADAGQVRPVVTDAEAGSIAPDAAGPAPGESTQTGAAKGVAPLTVAEQRLAAIAEKRRAIQDRINQKSREQLNSLPVDLIPDYIELLGTYIEEGVIKTGALIKRLRADAGDSLDQATDDELRAVVKQAHTAEAARVQQKRDDVRATLATRFADLESALLGGATPTAPADVTAAAGKRPLLSNNPLTLANDLLSKAQEVAISGPARKVGQRLSTVASRAAANQHGAAARRTANALGSLVKGFAQTGAGQARSEQFSGARNRANSDAHHLVESLALQLADPAITDPAAQAAAVGESVRRLDRALDPDFYRAATQAQYDALLRGRIGKEAFGAMDEAERTALFVEHQANTGSDAPLTRDELTEREQQVYDRAREVYDFIHDASFAIGRISEQKYEENAGQYFGRTYDQFEVPDGVALPWTTMGGSKKVDASPYRQRGEVDAWKLENKSRDALATLATRFRQALANRAVVDYADAVAADPKLALPAGATPADAAAGNFVKMGDGYGELSGRYVTQSVAEDFKGFLFVNQQAQQVYDALRWVDTRSWYGRYLRNPLKKGVTVFNPGTQLGNLTMNYAPLALLAGSDPLAMVAETPGARADIKNYSPLYKWLISEGVVGAPVDGRDLIKQRELGTGALQPKRSLLGRAKDAAQDAYAGADDLAKVALFRALIHQGLSPAVAADRVKSSLQNANRVGKLYDVAARVPVFGNAFARWNGDFARIMGSAAVNRPLTAVAVTALWAALVDGLSELSGETPAERQVREGRSPKIPVPDFLGGPISTSVKIGKNALDLSRLIMPWKVFTAPGTDDANITSAAVATFAPIWAEGSLDFLMGDAPYTSNPAGEGRVLLGKLVKDPGAAALNVALDADFRGKSILDPDATRARETGITAGEEVANASRYLLRAYGLQPIGALADDLWAAASGEANYFGKQRTVPQTLLRFVGIKAEQFDKPEYAKALKGAEKGADNGLRGEVDLIRRIVKLRARGEITLETATARLNARREKLREAYVRVAAVAALKQNTRPSEGARQAAGERADRKVDGKIGALRR